MRGAETERLRRRGVKLDAIDEIKPRKSLGLESFKQDIAQSSIDVAEFSSKKLEELPLAAGFKLAKQHNSPKKERESGVKAEKHSYLDYFPAKSKATPINTPELSAKKQSAPQIEKSKDSKKRKKAELAQKSTLKEKLKSPEKPNDN